MAGGIGPALTTCFWLGASEAPGSTPEPLLPRAARPFGERPFHRQSPFPVIHLLSEILPRVCACVVLGVSGVWACFPRMVPSAAVPSVGGRCGVCLRNSFFFVISEPVKCTCGFGSLTCFTCHLRDVGVCFLCVNLKKAWLWLVRKFLCIGSY